MAKRKAPRTMPTRHMRVTHPKLVQKIQKRRPPVIDRATGKESAPMTPATVPPATPAMTTGTAPVLGWQTVRSSWPRIQQMGKFASAKRSRAAHVPAHAILPLMRCFLCQMRLEMLELRATVVAAREKAARDLSYHLQTERSELKLRLHTFKAQNI